MTRPPTVTAPRVMAAASTSEDEVGEVDVCVDVCVDAAIDGAEKRRVRRLVWRGTGRAVAIRTEAEIADTLTTRRRPSHGEGWGWGWGCGRGCGCGCGSAVIVGLGRREEESIGRMEVPVKEVRR